MGVHLVSKSPALLAKATSMAEPKEQSLWVDLAKVIPPNTSHPLLGLCPLFTTCGDERVNVLAVILHTGNKNWYLAINTSLKQICSTQIQTLSLKGRTVAGNHTTDWTTCVYCHTVHVSNCTIFCGEGNCYHWFDAFSTPCSIH